VATERATGIMEIDCPGSAQKTSGDGLTVKELVWASDLQGEPKSSTNNSGVQRYNFSIVAGPCGLIPWDS